MNIDKIVLQDLIGNDIVPKKSKLLGKFRCFFKSVIHNCYDDLSFFPLFFVLFFVYGLECFFFFANDSLQHQYSSWRINRWLLRKQLALAGTKYSIDKIVRQVLILMILYPRYQDKKGTSKPFGNSDASSNS